MVNIYGVDVSKYQGNINWTKVKAAGKNFAFIRLGWAGWDGEISKDSMYDANMRAAKAAGLHVGVYVYSYCKTFTAAKTAAYATLEAVKPYAPLEYPIAFDIEDTSDSGTRYDKMSKEENGLIVSAFLDVIANAGYYGLLYTYKYFADAYLKMSELEKRYDVWIAQYAANCTYAGKYGIWQYAGETGKCEGISTACDLNVSYKDYADIIKTSGLNGFKTVETAPPVEPDNTELAILRSENVKLKNKISQIKEILEV